jgi:hypothetical protein
LKLLGFSSKVNAWFAHANESTLGVAVFQMIQNSWSTATHE